MISTLTNIIKMDIKDKERFNLFYNDNIIRLNEMIIYCDDVIYGDNSPFIMEEELINENPYQSKIVLFFEKLFEIYGTNVSYLYESSNEAFNFEKRTTYKKGSLINNLKFVFEKYGIDFKKFIYFSGDMNTYNKKFDYTQISALFMFHHNNFINLEWSEKQLQKKFLFLNKQPKTERYILYKELDSNVLNNSFYSFNAIGNPNYEIVSLENTTVDTNKSWNDLSEYYNKSFCSIITESEYFSNDENGYCYNSIAITEKTGRALNFYHPFILVGCKHSLKFLKSIGFKTFDKWWDESYDDIDDDFERLKKIKETIGYVNSLSLEELNNIYLYMKEDLIHNKNLFLKFKNKRFNYEYFFPTPYRNYNCFY